MKILVILSFNPYFQSSASANRWLTLIEGLSSLGVKVELLIYGGFNSVEEAAINRISEYRERVTCKYIEPKLIQGYWKRRYNTYIGDHLREGRLVKLIIEEIENKGEIVWTDPSLFGYKLAIQLKKSQPNLRLFLELSEFPDIHKYNKGNFLQRFQANKSQKFFEEKAFHVYDGLALMTKTLFQHYQSFAMPHPKFLHLPMTVNLERFTDGKTLVEGFQQPYIAFVGVMNDAKDGVSILIKAFAKITKEYPALKLYLVGAWNYDTPIHQQLIKEYKLEDKVFWMGEFSSDQIPSILKNASLLVLPRPPSKQAQGGFPTKLGEYLATSNPICATNVGEIPDYLIDGESVYFAEPGSIVSFANAMHRALSNPTVAKKVGANGKIVADKSFNKDIQAKILYDFLRENLQS